MRKQLLLLIITSLLTSALVGGCGPSAKDWNCAQNWLQRAKEISWDFDVSTAKALDEVIRAAESHDEQAFDEALENFWDAAWMTLMMGDLEHISELSNRALEYVGRAQECLK